MTAPGRLPRVLASALSVPGGSCYRHCDRPIRAVRIPRPLPGELVVRACPSGVVSVTVYTAWTQRDPTAAVGRLLRRWTVPATLVRRHDLRTATRHGPELGRPAERWLAAQRRPPPIRVVYWRVYPFRARDGSERRLFVCHRRHHAHPMFYADSPTAPRGCPVGTPRRRR